MISFLFLCMVLLMHATTAYRMGTSRLRLGSQLFATTSLPSGRESPSSKLIHANSKEAPVKEAINPLLVHQPTLPQLNLPTLSEVELKRLANGERIQKQSRDGRAGNGLVVVDVDAQKDQVFQTLLNFERYDKMIPTIRQSKVMKLDDATYQAQYYLSKFKLKVNIIHTVEPEQDLIRFFTDPNRKNLAMKHADGFWYVQSLPGVENRTRVWLTANLIVTSLVPNLIVDYAASRALPRATNWLQPYFQGKPLSDSFTC